MPAIVIPEVKIESVANIREHWAKKAKRSKSHRRIGWASMFGFKFPDGDVTVTLVRIAPRMLDSDNLASAFKSFRDGVADSMGRDDGHASVTWLYKQEKGRPKEYAVRVEVV